MAIQGYTKLFSSIVTSTIWSESNETRLVWITMLALSDRDGMVPGSIPGLAHIAHVTVEQCEKALEALMAPDHYSRSQEHEGRRIEKVDGGWRLLNHGKYRKLLSLEERRAYLAAKQREYRKRQSTTSTNVSDTDTVLTHTDSDSDSDSDSEEKHTTASVSPLGSPEFKAFIEAYPIKMKGRDALHEWVRQMLDNCPGEVMESLARWKECERWQNPQFIPYAHNWLKEWRQEPIRGVSKNEQKRNATKQAIERVRARLA